MRIVASHRPQRANKRRVPLGVTVPRCQGLRGPELAAFQNGTQVASWRWMYVELDSHEGAPVTYAAALQQAFARAYA